MTESQIVDIPYKNGHISVKKYSRIKIYKMACGSTKGFLVDYNKDCISILVPSDYHEFDEKKVKGKETKIYAANIRGFNFYPEVTVLETKEGD